MLDNQPDNCAEGLFTFFPFANADLVSAHEFMVIISNGSLDDEYPKILAFFIQ